MSFVSLWILNSFTHYLSVFYMYVDLGLQQPRLEGDEYLSVIDEFMEAVYARWPNVIVQV